MNDLIEIVDAQYLEDYKVIITFNNGVKKIVNLSNELNGEIFEPLKNPEYFKQLFVNKELGIMQWPNDADIAPEHLYNIGQTVE